VNRSLNELLKATSRSFYLTLRMFPKGIREQIRLAYLLARTSDTVADTEIIPVERRLDALEFLRAQMMESHHKKMDLGEFVKQQGKPAERMLLERCEETIDALDRCNSADQFRIRDVLKVIISGQELDLRRFKGNILIEMSGKNIFPRVGELPYLLTLGSYQFFWFRLRKV